MILLGRLGCFACESCAFPSLVPPSSELAWEPGHGHGASLISPCCWSANADEEDPKALLAQRHLPLQALEQLLARPFCLCRPLCLSLPPPLPSAAASSSRTTRRSNSAACNRPIRALRRPGVACHACDPRGSARSACASRLKSSSFAPSGGGKPTCPGGIRLPNERQKCLDLAPSVGRPLLGKLTAIADERGANALAWHLVPTPVVHCRLLLYSTHVHPSMESRAPASTRAPRTCQPTRVEFTSVSGSKISTFLTDFFARTCTQCFLAPRYVVST